MITLTPIIAPQKLDEYYRFRANVYSKSAVSGFLENLAFDKDRYDSYSSHFGYYNNELTACIRFIHPTPYEDAFYSFSLLPDSIKLTATRFAESCVALKRPIVELSRICVLPQKRNKDFLREFSLAIISKLIELKIDNALFTAFGPHRPLWEKYGCTVLSNDEGWLCSKVGATCFLMAYQKENIPAKIIQLLHQRRNHQPAA